MEQELSEEIIKDQYELYNRLKNNTRKELLAFLYSEPRNYKDLAEFSGLKPGSLYHHLKVLEPLVEKYEYGQYKITLMGKQIIESLEMIDPHQEKPKVSSMKSESSFIEFEEENEEKSKISESEEKDVTSNHSNTQEVIPKASMTSKTTFETGRNDVLYHIWLSPTSYILFSISLLVMILLGLQGVAFAGSAIYAVGDSNAFLIDLLAIVLGIGSLFIIEDLIQRYPIYDRVKFILVIRIISMLPSLIIGITLLLLFWTGIVPQPAIYPFIFTISLVIGTISMSLGIYYLRAQSLSDAILYATLPSTIDLLIGIVILLSV